MKRQNVQWRDRVNMAEPPTDRRRAHSADKSGPGLQKKGSNTRKQTHTHSRKQIHWMFYLTKKVCF